MGSQVIGLSISNFSPPSYLKKKHSKGYPGSGARWEANLDKWLMW